MNPQEMQQTNPQMAEMTPDEAKASLGIATRLSQQVFNPQQAQQTTDGQTNGQPNENIDKKFEMFMKEVRSVIKDEIGGLKSDIQDALKEESNGEEE